MAKMFLLVTLTLISVVTINCENLNFVYRISEEKLKGYKVGTVATDTNLHSQFNPEEIQRLRYAISSQGNTADTMFEINENTSELATTKVIDRDTECANKVNCEMEFDVMVYVVDSNTDLYDLRSIIRITVVIEDINDNPPIFQSESISLSVPESTAVGQVMLTSPAYDLDTGVNNSVQTYEMIPDEGIFELKVINNVGGSQDLGIVVKKAFDRETREMYNFKIFARDGGKPQMSGTVDVTILVTDVNDNTPIFKKQTFNVTVSEDIPLRKAILSLEAEDKDVDMNGAMSFFFNSRTSEKNKNYFEINEQTGEIYPIKHLDFEEETRYQFLVVVKDNGSSPRSSQAEVIINVADVNDNAPQILVKGDGGIKQISEDAENNTFIAHVNVIDADSDKNGEVECSVSDDHFRAEKFSFQYYKILLKQKLDFEVTDTFKVNITCTDKGTVPRSNSTSITLKVLDVNDNAPTFHYKNYTAYMTENNVANNLIMTLTATDLDGIGNNEVSYAIVEYSEDLVYIDTNKGEVRTKKSIDRELYSSFWFKVEARDNGSPSMSSFVMVTVIVDDVNDEGPKFTKPHFEFDVAEGRPISTSVGKLQAIDKDASPTFLYSLIDNDVAEVFTINSANGEIFTLKSLDRIMQNRYDFSVMVRDGQIMNFNDTTTVTVYIVEDTSVPPTILYPAKGNNSIKIPFDAAIGDTLVFIRAETMASDNRKVKFLIEHGNEDEFFKLDQNHGNLTVAKTMNLKDVGKYKLLISSHYENNPGQKSFVTLDIVIAGSATSEEDTKGYIVIVIVIVCVTVVLAGAILLAICLMKRVDRERREGQRRKREDKEKNYQMANIEKIAGPSSWEAEKQLHVMVKPTPSFKEEKHLEKKRDTTDSVAPTIMPGKKIVQFADRPVIKVEDDVSNLSAEADSGHGGSEEDFNSNARYLFLHSDSDSSQQLSPCESFDFRPETSILSSSSLKEWLVETPRRVNLPHNKEELQRSHSTDNYCLEREVPRHEFSSNHHSGHDRLTLNHHNSFPANPHDNFSLNRQSSMTSDRHDSFAASRHDSMASHHQDNIPSNRHPPSKKTSLKGSQKSVRFNVEDSIDDSDI